MQAARSLSALFVFDCPPHPETFVIELTDEEKIEHARRILSGKETERVHVSGEIRKTPAPYNPPWLFHLAPESITFFAFAIEVCDAYIQYVADHLAEVGGAFLPGNHWCPWGSRLLREVPAK
jgi:hypothetical protein